jgi:hypothetical protein
MSLFSLIIAGMISIIVIVLLIKLDAFVFKKYLALILKMDIKQSSEESIPTYPLS